MALDKRKDISVEKSRRYTGDGGVDGVFYLKRNGEKIKYYIQAKRYKNTISKKHVENFANLCAKDGVKGLFIHTGKTPLPAKDLVKIQNHVKIISGEKLLDFLKTGSF